MKRVTTREGYILSGMFGAILSGIIVWAVTENTKLTAELTALKTIAPQIEKTRGAAIKAEAQSEEAINRAEKALENVRETEVEAKRIVTNLKATPLFEKVDKSMGELRETAKKAAFEEATILNEKSVLSLTSLFPQDDNDNPMSITAGQTPYGATNWKQYNSEGISLHVDTTKSDN